MEKKSGLSMVELLVACVILIFVVSATVTSFVSMKQITRNLGYHYLAMNLAKEPLEFGEAGNYSHNYAFKYYYRPATSNTIPANLSCGVDGTEENITGYQVKEWRCFMLSNPHPFMYMGDIKANGLVPAGAPDSVEIYYYAHAAPLPFAWSKSDPISEHVVEISWQDEEAGERRKEIASVVPIKGVNDQLRLLVSEFWWE